MLKGPVALAAYEWVNGQIGHMMNPIGEGESVHESALKEGVEWTVRPIVAYFDADVSDSERRTWILDSALEWLRDREY